MKVDISVIIPAYNAEKYIERCIESISCQTHKDLEIIVVNDGSTDNTQNILERIAKDEHRIKIIKKINEGQGPARNKGIEVARGKYIVFADADDWLEDNAYETLFKIAEEKSCDIIACSYNMAYPDGRIECKKNLKDMDIDLSKVDINSFLYDYFFKIKVGSSVWNKMYRSELIKSNSVLMGNTRIGEDFFFNLSALVYSSKVCIVNKPLYNYFQPEQSVTRKYSKGVTKEYMNYLPKFINLIKNEGNYNLFYPFTSMIVYRALSNGVFNAFCVDGKTDSIYREICDGLQVEFTKKVIADTIKFQHLNVVNSRSLRWSIQLLFILLNIKAHRSAAFYQKLRCIKRMKKV